MKPNSLENLLKQDAPQPDPAARVAARRAALAEFARTNPQTANDKANDVTPKPRNPLQGLLGLLRISSQTRGSDTMPWYMRRGALSGAAGVCIAVIGSVLVWTTLQHDPDVVELNSPVPPPTAPLPPAQRHPTAHRALGGRRRNGRGPQPRLRRNLPRPPLLRPPRREN